MISRVIEMKMGAHQDINILRRQAELTQPVPDVMLRLHDWREIVAKFRAAKRGIGLRNVLAMHPRINQNVFSIAGFNHVPNDGDDDSLPDPTARGQHPALVHVAIAEIDQVKLHRPWLLLQYRRQPHKALSLPVPVSRSPFSSYNAAAWIVEHGKGERCGSRSISVPGERKCGHSLPSLG